jgi:hypothetical protein
MGRLRGKILPKLIGLTEVDLNLNLYPVCAGQFVGPVPAILEQGDKDVAR